MPIPMLRFPRIRKDAIRNHAEEPQLEDQSRDRAGGDEVAQLGPAAREVRRSGDDPELLLVCHGEQGGGGRAAHQEEDDVEYDQRAVHPVEAQGAVGEEDVDGVEQRL